MMFFSHFRGSAARSYRSMPDIYVHAWKGVSYNLSLDEFGRPTGYHHLLLAPRESVRKEPIGACCALHSHSSSSDGVSIIKFSGI